MPRNEVNNLREAPEPGVSVLAGSAHRRDAILIKGGADELDGTHYAAERELAVRSLAYVLRKLQDAGAKRLAAAPWTTLCIRCREAVDCHCGAKNARQVFAVAA